MIACVSFMIINIYRLYYYYYCFEMDGVFDVHFLWTYGVWVLIPSRFRHSEFISATNFQLEALADEMWVISSICNILAPKNQNITLFS